VVGTSSSNLKGLEVNKRWVCVSLWEPLPPGRHPLFVGFQDPGLHCSWVLIPCAWHRQQYPLRPIARHFPASPGWLGQRWPSGKGHALISPAETFVVPCIFLPHSQRPKARSTQPEPAGFGGSRYKKSHVVSAFSQ
jgi:hypothetical protein